MGVSSYSLGSAGKNWIISGADMLVGIHPSALSAFTDAPSAFESALLYMQWFVIMLQFSYLLSKCCARQGSCCQRLCCCCSTGSSLNIFNCIWSLTVFELFIALPLFGVQFYNFILNFDNSFNPELSDRDLQCYDATDTLFAVIGVFFFLQKVYTAVMYVFMIASSFVGVRYRVSKQYREFVDNAVELVGKSDYKAQVRVQSTVLSVEEKELVSTGAGKVLLCPVLNHFPIGSTLPHLTQKFKNFTLKSNIQDDQNIINLRDVRMRKIFKRFNSK